MPSPAIAAALALASDPTLAPAMRKRPLPEGVDEILKVFARREEDLTRLLRRVNLDCDDFVDCVDNYIQKIVLHPSGDPYRMLAGTPEMSRADLRLNMKFLLEGLHPDKTGGSWKSAYAPRVIDAWRDISSGRAVAQKWPMASSRRRRRLPWISHPVPARQRRSVPWRMWLVLAGVIAALFHEWPRVESSILAIAGSFSP